MASNESMEVRLNFERIVQQMKVTREFISDKKVKIVHPSGLSYEAFNGKAQVTPWSLLRMVELARVTAFCQLSNDQRSFLNIHRIYENQLVSVASTKMEISQQIYDYSVAKGPLDIVVELVNVGKTSFDLKTSMFLPGVETPVCENLAQSVFVDLETRQPSAPPGWWVDKYGDTHGESLKLERHLVPDSGFLTDYQVKVSASDLDPYWHTNWTHYVRFSYEAFVNHAVNKYGTGNLARSFRKCKEFSVLYLKETGLLDTLDIRVFKNPGNANLFKFQFLKASDAVCESSIVLYPHSDA